MMQCEICITREGLWDLKQLKVTAADLTTLLSGLVFFFLKCPRLSCFSLTVNRSTVYFCLI